MSRWWRAYDDALNDAKIQHLPPSLFKTWFNVLCVASKNNGTLPPLKELALLLRLRPERCQLAVSKLTALCLLDDNSGVLSPHNWATRQYISDLSTQRVSKHRKRFSNVAGNVSETPPDTDTDTERKIVELRSDDVSRETSSSPPAESPSGLATKHHFESGVIKLKESDFANWEKAFSHLDLRAELTAIGRTDWAVNLGSKWFVPVSQLLAKRNREQKTKAETSKTGEPFKWRSGIEGVV